MTAVTDRVAELRALVEAQPVDAVAELADDFLAGAECEWCVEYGAAVVARVRGPRADMEVCVACLGRAVCVAWVGLPVADDSPVLVQIKEVEA